MSEQAWSLWKEIFGTERSCENCMFYREDYLCTVGIDMAVTMVCEKKYKGFSKLMKRQECCSKFKSK